MFWGRAVHSACAEIVTRGCPGSAGRVYPSGIAAVCRCGSGDANTQMAGLSCGLPFHQLLGAAVPDLPEQRFGPPGIMAWCCGCSWHSVSGTERGKVRGQSGVCSSQLLHLWPVTCEGEVYKHSSTSQCHQCEPHSVTQCPRVPAPGCFGTPELGCAPSPVVSDSSVRRCPSSALSTEPASHRSGSPCCATCAATAPSCPCMPRLTPTDCRLQVRQVERVLGASPGTGGGSACNPGSGGGLCV